MSQLRGNRVGKCFLLNHTHRLRVISLKGNPIYCNCFMRPLKGWATAGGAKLLGACAGPPHLSDEPLQAVTSLDLRCRSRGETLKEEEEEEEKEKEKESKKSVPATAKPKQTATCPINCECDVSVFFFVETDAVFHFR